VTLFLVCDRDGDACAYWRVFNVKSKLEFRQKYDGRASSTAGKLIGRGLIGRRTTGPNARVAATPLSDWHSAIYDRSAHACVANLADHANLQ